MICTPWIQIDALWLATQPIDMRGGANALLARVAHVFGTAQAHQGYLFANTRTSHIKLLVHDGFAVWCAAWRLNAGRFVWPRGALQGSASMTLTQLQFDALVPCLPWERLEQMGAITRMWSAPLHACDSRARTHLIRAMARM